MMKRGARVPFVALGLLAACSSSDLTPTSSSSTGFPGASASSSGGAAASTSGSGGAAASTSGSGGANASASSSGGAPDFNYDPSGAGGSGGSCATTEIVGKKAPVDIVFAVDTSSSMSAEIAQVKANINGSFADVLGQGALDYRLVMLATKGTDSLAVCVAPPLGGPNCGSNLPLYRMVPQTVGSTNALSLLLSTYDSENPQHSWSGFLRKEATKTFIVVTDDDSAMSASAFDTALLAKAPVGMFGDANQRKYVFYGIIGIDKNNPAQKCATAFKNGLVYQSLVALTKGSQFSECEADYGPIFKAIADNVVSKLSCEYSLPKNDPNGQAIDAEKVSVKLVDGMNFKTTFPRVDDASKCAGEGWYYEDNLAPSKILLCPAACSKVQVAEGAQVTVDVGCLQG
ncbi:MAG: VWA domain-containing protein [Deltaproteobacteria bacterium]|nr:VWA domain-containing protein [Deltaproteobacteria bacterium]